MSLTFDTKQDTLSEISKLKQRYDSILEHATDDAVESLVTVDEGGNPIIEKEESINIFFHSLYAGFGVMNDPDAQDELKRYIPMIAVLDKDGVYIWYHGTYENNGTNYTEMWSEKYPYSKSYKENGNEYYIDYTMDDKVHFMDSSDNSIIITTYKDLYSAYPSLTFLSQDGFDEERRYAIISTITNKMNQYINEYNRIAEIDNIDYQFVIPYLSDEDWTRSIDDISILVFFQGYPYGNFTTERYNQYEVSCARTKKTDKFFISEKNGKQFYHRSDCPAVDVDTMQPYDDKRSCAIKGAYPCPDCNP